MTTDLKEIQTKIDIKLAELRQQAHYAINKYDYHHKNDELQIIEQQKDILNQVAGTYAKFLNEMQKFNQTLNDAKEMSAGLDQLLMQLKPTTQQSPTRPNEPEREALFESDTKDKLKDTISKKQLFPPS